MGRGVRLLPPGGRAGAGPLRATERGRTLHPRGGAAAHIGRAAEPTVFRGRGAAFDSLGDFDAARADYETALAAARSLHAPGEEIKALLALGLLWAGHDYAKTGDYLRAAMDLARQTGAAAALARSLNRLGNWHGNAMQPSEAIRDHQEALAIFEKLGDTRGVAQTLDVLGMAHLIGGDQIAGRPRTGEPSHCCARWATGRRW